MSNERHTRNRLSPNLLQEPARINELTSIQIARRALEIRDDVRRVLNYESDESLSANIIAEHEYPYDANDYSLIAPSNEFKSRAD